MLNLPWPSTRTNPNFNPESNFSRCPLFILFFRSPSSAPLSALFLFPRDDMRELTINWISPDAEGLSFGCSARRDSPFEPSEKQRVAFPSLMRATDDPWLDCGLRRC